MSDDWLSRIRYKIENMRKSFLIVQFFHFLLDITSSSNSDFGRFNFFIISCLEIAKFSNLMQNTYIFLMNGNNIFLRKASFHK